MKLQCLACLLLALNVEFRIAADAWRSRRQNTSDNKYKDIQIQVFANGESDNGMTLTLTADDCREDSDVGDILCPRVPQLLPLEFVKTKQNESLSCMLFSSWGIRLTFCSELSSGMNTHIVPSHRLFMWPTYQVGHTIELHHILPPQIIRTYVDPITKKRREVTESFDKSVVLETVSVRPRVFRLHNFLSDYEATYLSWREAMTDEHSNFDLNSTDNLVDYKSSSANRSCDVASDSDSEVAKLLKRRVLDLMGVYPYDDSYCEGIQFMKYSVGQAYTTHYDYINHKVHRVVTDHNWETKGNSRGSNRYATVLMYLSDVLEGGETSFPEAKRLVSDNDEVQEGISTFLRERNLETRFPENSWQRDLLVQCRSKFSVKAVRLQVLLFYNQLPDGRQDAFSKHADCPVIAGNKLIGKIWVWNGPRAGLWHRNNSTGLLERPRVASVSASFESKDVIGAALFWREQLWEELEIGRAVKVNTFPGHEWSIRLLRHPIPVKIWTINDDKPVQRFVLTSDDLPVFD